MEKLARWTAKHIPAATPTTRYALRSGAAGTGKELGAYSTWHNPRAEEAADRIAGRIEEEAYAQGYKIWSETLEKFLSKEEADRAY